MIRLSCALFRQEVGRVACIREGARQAAVALAMAHRGKGVALDEFTAWVGAEMEVLDLLKTWFGRVLVSRSVIDEIDDLIRKHRDSLGRLGMTVGWRDGQYIGQELTDDILNEQIHGLEKLKARIGESCEVKAVVLADRMPDFASNVLKLMDEHALDPIYLALAEAVPLLSDDMRYRNVATVVALSDGLWLQAALLAALRASVAERTRVYRAFVELAARKHRHMALDTAPLRGIYDLSGDKLDEFNRHVLGELADKSGLLAGGREPMRHSTGTEQQNYPESTGIRPPLERYC